MIYKPYLYKERLYESSLYTGYWEDSVNITYTAGMGVVVKADWTATVPAGTTLKVECSFDNKATWSEFSGSGGLVEGWFSDSIGGSEDIWVKVTFTTNEKTKTPRVDSLTLTISQYVTILNIIYNILLDYGLETTEFWVDPELLEYRIPRAYVDNITHREALRLAVEACLGQCYVDRNGILRVEGPSFLEDKTTPDLTITRSEIFEKNIPAVYEDLKNRIVVRTQPLEPVDIAEEVYRSADPITIPANRTKQVTIFYTEKPVKEGNALLDTPPAGCTVDSVTYYVWGAVVTLKNTNSESKDVILYVEGKPLRIIGSQEITRSDGNSILENGTLNYEYPDNPFVQTEEMAEKIAEKLLASYKDARRDIEMDWRGNPALVLADRIKANDYRDINWAEFFVTEQTFTYDGTLRSTLKGRRA